MFKDFEKVCCFTGSRACELTGDYVYKVVLDLIHKGYKYFGTGGAVGFDTLVAQGVLKAKHSHPNIRLILVLPFKNQDRFFSAKQKKQYAEILHTADKVVYIAENFSNSAYLKRNRHLVNNSALCVAHCPRATGGAYYTVSYARAVGTPVVFV